MNMGGEFMKSLGILPILVGMAISLLPQPGMHISDRGPDCLQ